MLKGPAGLPGVRTPDGREAGLLGGHFRMALDLYANVRPVRLWPGVVSALRDRDAGGIDYVIVRENTEGLYASRLGGVVVGDEAAADTMLITRKGTERVSRYAFELARRRQGAPADGVRRVTCVDKANVLKSYAFFRKVFTETAKAYPDVEADVLHADACAQALVLWPERFDVIVCENLLGDLLSDLGGATAGGIALSPSGNIGDRYAVFEPVHGSAPDLAGTGTANPLAMILTAGMLLGGVGEREAQARVESAVASLLAEGAIPLTATGATKIPTAEIGNLVAARVTAR
ncbi:MAG: isocitrate/isopropylmalate dehydrogenase family protein [Candidatus Rokubacteria bacterium]|nr:isocitrate/isopropylmalate dehydrogenase family protein [Candidatus Rokubacteria bacterium]